MVIASTLFAATFGLPFHAETQPTPRYRPDRILVKPAVPNLETLHARVGARIIRKWPQIGNIEAVELPRGITVEQALAIFRCSGWVEYAEPDYIVEEAATYPNDPRFTDQTLWNLHNTGQQGGTPDADIDAPEGWDTKRDAGNIIVAVIDSGIRYDHQDLAANMWKNLAELNGSPIYDDDGNGYVDDIYGINAINGTGNPMDDRGHGSHVAGIIGARGNNGLGVVGVAWNVQLMALKFLDSTGNGSVCDAIECINYAIAKRAHVINASWGITSYSESLREAIAAARNQGILFVSAAGNESYDLDDLRVWPACYDLDNIFTVLATTRNDTLASYSSHGTAYVHLGAPGGDGPPWPPSNDPKTNGVYSTSHTSTSAYAWLYGTSMAAPHVAGALALLRSYFPYESYLEHKNRLMSTVDSLSGPAANSQSGGRLSLSGAFAVTWPPRPPCNDSFSKAIWINQPYNADRVTAVANNVNASKETGEPSHAGNPGGRSIWFRFTAWRECCTELSTEGSGFNTLLAVYTGNSVSELTLVTSNAGSCGTSRVYFAPIPNTTYHVAVDGYNGAEGTVKLTCRLVFPPSWLPSLTFILNSLHRERSAGRFSVDIQGPASSPVRLDRSADLVTWVHGYARFNLDASGAYHYSDLNATGAKAFYRVAIPGQTDQPPCEEPPLELPRQTSCNVVGYVDLAVPTGDSLIANPLRASDNRVVALFPSVPDGTTVYKYGPNGWIINTFDGEWTDPNMTVTPGEGILFRNPPRGPSVLTFVGQVVQGYGVNPLDNGWSLRSSIIPQVGRVTTDLLFPVQLPGEKVLRMVNGSYVEYTYGSNGWTPSEPQVGVGEAFFSYKDLGAWWKRNFLVWP